MDQLTVHAPEPSFQGWQIEDIGKQKTKQNSAT